MSDPKTIASSLTTMEREWLTGWKGVGGAAFNAIATSLRHKGLLRGPLDWNLSRLGEAVKAELLKADDTPPEHS